MPPVKIKSPTLIGGISQQPPHLRFANQVEAAVNVMFDVGTGAAKRPGSELVCVPESLSNDGNYQIQGIDRGDSVSYIIIVGENGSGATTLQVIQSDGREATVNVTSNAQTYLNAGNPVGGDFRFAVNPDTVIILNRKATATATTPGTPDATTMPIKLTRSTAPTSAAVAVFAADVNTWTARDGTSGGDNTSNPGFSTIVSGSGQFSDVAFYRERLVLAGDQYISFSQASAYFNFYIQDVASIVDDDPLEAELDGDIQAVQSFLKALVVFTADGKQYESNSADLLTPTTLAFDPTTRYETQDVKPVVLGSALYFVGNKLNGSILYEYLYNDTQLTSVASDTSRHVDKLLPDSIRSMDGSAANTTVLMLPTNQPVNEFLLLEGGDKILLEGGDDILLDQSPVGSNTLYVYRYYWTGNDKQQSAWALWTFDDEDRIADITVIDGYVYMLTRISDAVRGETDMILDRVPISPVRTADDGMPYVVHLDRWEKIIGSFGDPETSWEVSSAALAPDRMVFGPSFANAGEVVELEPFQGAEFSVDGEYDQAECYIGQAFQYTLTPTRLYRRDRNGAADVLGELLINKVGVHHFESAHYDLTVSAPRRADRTKSFDVTDAVNGTTEAYYGGDADDTTITIESTSPKPTTVSAYEVEANYYPRA